MSRTVVWLVLAIVIISMSPPSLAKASVPKFLRKVESQVDLTNVVQARVYEVIKHYADDFALVRTTPFNDVQKRAMIDDLLKFPDVMGVGSMERLRQFESMADAAYSINISIPDSDGYYYQQVVVAPGSETTMSMVQFTFDVPFADRVEFAHSLVKQIKPLFAKDKKWMLSGTEDPALNPLYGQVIFVYNIKAGVKGSEMLMVGVHYGHTELIHEASGGVYIKIHSMRMKF